MIDAYAEFLARKSRVMVPAGMPDSAIIDNPKLFGFQRDVVRLSLRRGKSVVMIDTGLGKGFIQLDALDQIGRYTNRPTLILAPLAVSRQFEREAAKLGTSVHIVREATDVHADGIHVTNYERLGKLDLSVFGGVACDEASIIKNFAGATRNAIVEGLASVPYRLFLSATPAPNDYTEFGNYVEACGVMRYSEYLATFYVHDMDTTQDWRLKKHGVDQHWRFLASFMICARKPGDLGHADEDARYELPAIAYHEHKIATPRHAAGLLFAEDASTLADQRALRRDTLAARVAEAARIVNETTDPTIVWCDLNAEGDALEKAIPGSVQVSGSDTDEEKEDRILGFVDGRYRVLITKPKIASQGLNFQHCARVVFCGVTHSFEAFYQAVRRCWRFGQTRPVDVHVIYAEGEGAVMANLRRKHEQFVETQQRMVAEMRDATLEAIGRATARRTIGYDPMKRTKVPSWMASNAGT